MSKYTEFADRVNKFCMGGLIPPHTENNSMVKIFRKLVREKDLEYVMELTDKLETAEEYAKRIGRPVEELRPVLKRVCQQGLIMSKYINEVPHYKLVPFIPGIIEFMVNPKTHDKEIAALAQDFANEFGSTLAPYFEEDHGYFRTIPLERSIEADSKAASFDQIVTYMNNYDYFACADCFCRKSKQLLGEGCDHLIDGMCICMGPTAEYYVRTGRGRQITKEEAYEILRKAEDDGLVHNIFNCEGKDNASFICNCCSCCCLEMRTYVHHKTFTYSKSSYRSEVDPEKCVACGECVKVCPVNALKLGNNICRHQPEKPVVGDTPYDCEWGADKWNHNYRHHDYIAEGGTSPCKTECPAHISIQGYIKKAAEGKYREALEIIKENNPFPAVCGRICPHNCESQCSRGCFDEPLAIDNIKRFIADQDMNSQYRYVPEFKNFYDKKVAIIGAGPSGLSCAYYLAVEGYKVTVFEKEAVPGGMMTLGIPSFRLDRKVVNSEIDVLRELGVEFKTGVEVGKDVTISELRQQNYKAFYIAIGAQGGRKLGVEGEDAADVISGVQFLHNVNLAKNIDAAKKDFTGLNVVVIGGGNVAIDVAQTVARLGAKSTEIVCLESREEMPAIKEEQVETMELGAAIHNSWGPKRILLENGKVKGVEFKKCTAVFDENGRFNPQYDENDVKVIKADKVITAIGQSIEWGNMLLDTKCELTPRNTLVVDEETCQSGDEDVFAGGDVVTGPKFVITAIAAGKQSAITIHKYLYGMRWGACDLKLRRFNQFAALDKEDIDFSGFDRQPRQKSEKVEPALAIKTFEDLRKGFTEEQVRKESKRCLSCGATKVDSTLCIGCGLCTTKCKFDAVKLVKERVVEPYATREELFQKTMVYAGERQQRIAAKKAK